MAVQTRNRLLALLPPEELRALEPHLEPIECEKHFTIAHPDQPFTYAYFLNRGIGSLIVSSPDGQKAEGGLFGREGFSPSFVVLGADRMPGLITMQVGGDGFRIPCAALIELVQRSAALSSVLLRYNHLLGVQTAFTALSNAVHPIDERLARWLLMCHDRSDSDDIPLTHEFLSIMLAVRRPSVTSSLHVLEGNGFIRSERGYVTIRNRAALEDFASDAYGKAEAEYLRVMKTPI